MLNSGQSEAATTSYIDTDRHSTQKALASGKERGVTVKKGVVRLRSGLTRGSLTSRVYRTSTKFDTLVPSWEARTPGPTWITVQVQVRSGGNWTRWFNLGRWAKETTPIRRGSFGLQSTSRWRVLTDTLQSKGRYFAGAYRYRIVLSSKKAGKSPRVQSLYVVASNSYRDGNDLGVGKHKKVWGKDLRVPARTQMVYSQGEAWCSPTSMSMVMAYWARRTGRSGWNQWPKNVARGVYDYRAKIWGNWPFNTAYAGSRGLDARVGRLGQIEQVEPWIGRGIPVIASISWDNRNSKYRLSGAPLKWSNGHILVIRGFTKSGNVIVNDPAAKRSSGVRRVYNRAQFERAWLRNGANRYGNYNTSGIVYFIRP
ncbi:peptidase C39 family protein [soil metagenome]